MGPRLDDPARPPLGGLLTDVWYTLLYYRGPERRVVEARRRGLLVEALASSGVRRRRAGELVRRWEAASARLESQGRTPPLADRLAALARHAPRPVPIGPLVDAMDGVVDTVPPRIAPGAMAALRAARRRGVRIGIVSNVVFESDAGTRRRLSALGLAELVDAIVLSADDGVAKPDPRPFRRCLRELGIRASAACYVGDLANDVLGAEAAGLAPIQYVGLRRYGPAGPILRPPAEAPPILVRWSDLPRLLRRGGALAPASGSLRSVSPAGAAPAPARRGTNAAWAVAR